MCKDVWGVACSIKQILAQTLNVYKSKSYFYYGCQIGRQSWCHRCFLLEVFLFLKLRYHVRSACGKETWTSNRCRCNDGPSLTTVQNTNNTSTFSRVLHIKHASFTLLQISRKRGRMFTRFIIPLQCHKYGLRASITTYSASLATRPLGQWMLQWWVVTGSTVLEAFPCT